MGHRQFPSLVSDFGGLATGDKEKNDDDDLSLGDLGIAADIDTAAADIHLAQTVRSLLKSARLRVFLEQLQQSLAVFSGPALLLGTCLLLRGDGYAAATAAAAMTTKTTKKKEEAAAAVTALRPSVRPFLVSLSSCPTAPTLVLQVPIHAGGTTITSVQRAETWRRRLATAVSLLLYCTYKSSPAKAAEKAVICGR